MEDNDSTIRIELELTPNEIDIFPGIVEKVRLELMKNNRFIVKEFNLLRDIANQIEGQLT